MLVAVTGTPGTGKTSACEVLSARGYVVVDLDKIARREGLIVGRDAARGSDEVDVEALREGLRIPAKVAFLRSHYSHRMAVNLAVVLRCGPPCCANGSRRGDGPLRRSGRTSRPKRST